MYVCVHVCVCVYLSLSRPLMTEPVEHTHTHTAERDKAELRAALREIKRDARSRFSFSLSWMRIIRRAQYFIDVVQTLGSRLRLAYRYVGSILTVAQVVR